MGEKVKEKKRRKLEGWVTSIWMMGESNIADRYRIGKEEKKGKMGESLRVERGK